MSGLDITIGICAYNEEGIIGQSIASIYEQETGDINVTEVIVVSSGSTDRTDEIVESLMKEHSNLRLIRQEKREGKNSAINCYLDNKSNEIVVMLNADNTFGTKDSLRYLVEPFKDPQVGMVGGHPVPVNDPKDKIGFAVHMLWAMHHNLAMVYPKIGELVAFRDIGLRLPTDQQSDEDLIRMNLENAGYKCLYAPDAIVRNRGPETLEDFMSQRIRVNIGEVNMKAKYDYDIPSWNKKYIMKAAFGTIHDLGFHPFKMAYALRLEMKARKEAERHIKSGDADMNIWKPVETTKKL
jgi:cellulose synthase/poly-beta-1,6-N-acetylglucosamine synthase-like glycosyltransferase